MGQGITVDISARVTGYEASLKLLLTAMAKLDPGADISKNLTKAFKDAESLVKALSKNMFPKATSDSLIDSILEKTNRAGEAILRVAQLMRSVNPGDLNLSALGSDFESLRTLIVTLENELEGKLNAGILKVVEDSSLLKGIFSELGVDLSKADAVTLFEEISKASLKATAEVEKAEEALAKIGNEKTDLMLKNTSLGQKRLGSIEGKDALGSELNNIVDQYNNVFEQLRNTMTTGMAKIKFDSGTSSKKLLDEFFKDLTPLNLEQHIRDLVLNIQNSSNLDLKTEIYKTVFGDNYNTTNINTLVKSIGLDLAYDLYKAAFLEFFRNIFNDISFKDLAKISSLVNNNDLDGAVKATTLALDNAYVEISKNIQKNKEQLAALLTDEQGLMLQLNTAKLALQTYSSAEADLRNLIELLRDLNKDLINQIEQLKEERNTKVGAAASGVRLTGNTALHNVSGQFFEGTEAALKYKVALEQVTARELMVGKIQGVVLRWFSIYAAIRMVGNAIRSVISTVKELDTTITEIAIVTKMDQNDLWGQMGKYTELARNYAASISGVYKVSLLYYQQGLLSTDVMALTELTLKMARISGLDYAEATDYMTNAIRSFKMEMTDALNVVDVYSAIAASSATSVTELATAMSKTASSALAVGASFENTTAMMAVMIEATRESPENIGSAMKSIISRYGELKEKKTGTDAEGEEYSLNKVDTALLSVGLSIHDVNGEFRDFDDVIMELASKWDTIDKNTQRYIATVMAGNRQQSRFLALVSSYDRLKELSAEAANSEDASLLQFLKTLDSVEAKTQLILTSLLSLYTSSGVETLYKTLLDLGNKVVKTFADISNKGDLTVMIGKIGAVFTNLAVLVTNAFSLIKLKFTLQKTLMLAEAKLFAALELASEVGTTLSTEELKTNIVALETENRIRLTRKERFAKAREATQELADLEKTNKKYNQLLKNNRIGMVLSAAGTAMTMWASTMDVNEQRGGKAALTGIGSLLSGVGTGMMIGGVAGGIVGAMTALPGIIEAIGMTIESVDEKVAKFKDNITKANNKKIVAKDELTTLKAYKDQLAELESHLYDSVESKKEYLALSNEIASSYPLLISYIDEEGNKIVQLGSAYDNLVKSKENAFRQELINTGNARINAVSDANTALSLLGIDFEALKDSGSTIKSIIATLGEYAPEGFIGPGLTHWAINLGLLYTVGWLIPTLSRFLSTFIGAENNGIFDLSSAAYNSIVPQLADTSFENLNYGKDSSILLYKRSDVLKALYGKAHFDNLPSEVSEALQELNLEDAYQKYGIIPSNETVLPALGAIVDSLIQEGKNEKEINGVLAQINSGLKIEGKALQYRLAAIKSTLEKYRDKLIEAENLELFSTAFAEQGTIAGTSYQLPYMQYQFLKLWEEYINPDNEDYEKNVVKNDKGGIDYALTWSKFSLYYEEFYLKALNAYKTMIRTAGDNTLDELESMMAEPTVYSANDWLNLLDVIGEDSDIGQFIKKYILDNITDTMKNYKEAFRNLGTRANINLDTKSGIISFIDNIGTLYIPNILSLYETILKNKSLSTSQKQALIAGLDNIYKVASDITDKTIQKSVLNNLQNADFTSLKGIFDVLKVLGNVKGLDLDKSGLRDAINGFKDTLLVNLTTEFESLFKEYTEGITEFEKTLSSASKGMDYATAAKLADTLGVTLSDFRFTAGKYYYDSLKDIEDYYIKITEELKQELEKKRDQLKTDLQALLNQKAWVRVSLFKDGKLLPSGTAREVIPLKELIEDSSLAITEESLKPYSPIFAEHGIKISDIVEKALEYRELIANHELDANTQFEEWLLSVVDELYLTQYDAVIRESDTYLKDLTARALLSSGNISGFLDTTLGKITPLYEVHTTEYYKDLAKKDLGRDATYELIMTRAKEIADTENAAAAAEAQKVAEDERKLLIDAIAGGEVDNLPDQLKSFAKLIYDTYHATASGILTSVTTAMKGGTNQIFVDEKNINLLQKMQKSGYIDQEEKIEVGKVVKFAKKVISGDNSFNNWIVETYKNEEERLKALQDFHAALKANTKFTDASNLMSKESIVGFNELTSYLNKYKGMATTDMFDKETGEYSYKFKDKLELYGLEINNLTGDFVIKNLEKYLTLLLEDLELLTEEGSTQELRNEILKRITDAKNNINKNRTESSKKLLQNYKSFSTDELESFANAFNLDFNDLKNELTIDNLDGTFKLNITAFLNKIKSLGDKITDEMQSVLDALISGIADDYLNNISTAMNYSIKGTTKLADMLSFINMYNELLSDEKIDMSAFSYDPIANQFKVSNDILNKYILTLKLELIALGFSNEAIDEYIKDLTITLLLQSMDVTSILSDKDTKGLLNAINKLAQSIESYRSLINDPILQEILSLRRLKAPEDKDLIANRIKELLQKLITQTTEELVKTLYEGGEEGVRALLLLKGEEVTSEEVSAVYNAKINRIKFAIESLEGGAGTILDGLAALIALNTKGIEKKLLPDGSVVITAVTSMVDAYMKLYANMKDTTENTTAELNSLFAKALTAREQGDIDAIDAMGNAMGMTYETLGLILAKTGDRLEDWLVSHDNMYDLIGNGKIRITDFEAFAADRGWTPGSEEYTSSFKTYNDSLIELNNKTEKNILSEVKGLSEAKIGDKINLTTLWTLILEGINALLGSEDWHDYLDENLQVSDSIKEKFAKLTANNVKNTNESLKKMAFDDLEKEFSKYGATFEKGILTIGADANILGIISSISRIASENANLLPNQLAELADTIQNYIKQIANLIKNAITGNLSNVDALSLQAWADANALDISKLDFVLTREGLKLSTQSAIQLYNALKLIDSLLASLVFDELNNSLKESNEKYASVTSIMARIKELDTLIADEKTSNARKNQYKEELELAREILAVRSTAEDDSFNFMSNKIPAAQNNPLNYAKNLTQAFLTFRDAFDTSKVKKNGKAGFMDYEDWYNIVTEFNNMATKDAPIILSDAIKLDGTLTAASKAILAGAESLTTVDTGELKVNLTSIGIGIESGAAALSSGVTEGILGVAKALVQALDGLIAMLELIVAMEQLGDIDTDSNGIDLSDLFEVTYDEEGNITGHNTDKFSKDYEKWVEDIKKKINKDLPEYNKDLADAINGISIDGTALREILDWKPSDFTDSANESVATAYAAILDAFNKAALSGNYNLDSIQESVLDVLAESGFKDTVKLDIGDMTYVISAGTMTTINWQDTDTKTILKDLARKYDGDLKKARDELTAWIESYGKGELTGDTELHYVLLMKKKITMEGDKVTSVTAAGKTYKATPNNQKTIDAAMNAAVLEDFGYKVTEKDILTAVDAGITTVTVKTKIGNVDISVEAENGLVRLVSEDGKRKYKNLTEFLAGEWHLWQEDTVGKSREGLYKTLEEWQWGKYKIATLITPEFSYEVRGEAQTVNPALDTQLRGKLTNLITGGREAILALITKESDNKDGTYTVDLGEGYKFTFTGGVDPTTALELAIGEQLGIDVGLSNTISTAIANAFANKNVSDSVSKAISDGLTKVFVGADGKPLTVPIPEIILKPDNVTIDTSSTSLAESDASSLELSIDNLKAIISSYDDSSANITDLLTNAITGIITAYDDSKADITTVANTIVGIITSYDDSSADTSTLANAIKGIITLYDDSSADKTTLANALTGIITTYMDPGADKSGILKSLVAFITEYDDSEAKKPTLDDLILFINEINTSGADAALAAWRAAQEAKSINIPIESTNPSPFKQSGAYEEQTFANWAYERALHTRLTSEEELEATGYDFVYTPSYGETYSGVDLPEGWHLGEDGKLYTNQVPVHPYEVATDNGWETVQVNDEGIEVPVTGKVEDVDVSEALADPIELDATVNHAENFYNNANEDEEIILDEETNVVATEFDDSVVTEKTDAGYSTTVNVESSTTPTIPTDLGPDTGSITQPVTIEVSGEEKIDEVLEKAAEGAEIGITAVDKNTSAVLANIKGQASNTHPKVTIITNNNDITLTILKILSELNSATLTATVSTTSSGGGTTGATGSFGLARAAGTLMGELGPELVVQNGRYFVAGLNGAEFVDLNPDAIVFNHLQTELLLKNGMSSTRGKAVTNERVATAYAKGNINGGPAMASAAAALAALKQLRAQWQALAGLSAQDLAGTGGGGGGGGGGDPKAFIKDLEKWYDWLQQIALLEKEITLEEAKRTKYQSDMVARGKEYFTSLKESLDLLQKQIVVLKSLSESQEAYFEKRKAELNQQSAFSALYGFSDSGQLYYKDVYKNNKSALEWLSDLAGRNATTGEANYTAEEQYNKLVDAGFGFAMKYDSSGNEIKQEGEDWYSTAVQAFWDKIEADKQEMLTLHDSVEDAKKKVYELENQLNEILKEIEDNLITVEQKVLKAVEESRLREIDELEKQRSAIEKSAKDMIDGLSDLLNKEKELYNLLNLADELSKLQRQLSILLRSGGSLAQIADLLKLIADKQLSLYFDTLLKQIDALQEASDNELERLDHLIEIMKETLDYLKEYGLLWNAVYELLLKSPADISAFIKENTKEYWGQSPTELVKTIREDLFEIERFKQFLATVEGGMDVLTTLYGDEVAEKKAEKKKKEEEEEAARKAEEEKKKLLELKSSSGSSGGNGSPKGKTPTKPSDNNKKWVYDDKTQGRMILVDASGNPTGAIKYDDAGLPTYGSTRYYEALNAKRQLSIKDIDKEIDTLLQLLSYLKTLSGYHGEEYLQKLIDALELKKANYEAQIKQTEVEIDLRKNGVNQNNPLNKIINTASLQMFATGGLDEYTGIAMLHGTKTKPEAVLNTEQTRILRNNILSNRPDSLISLLKSYNEAYQGLSASTYDSISNNSTATIIEHAEVNLNIEKLANDYDSKRAANTVMTEMLRIASKTSANNSVRR